MIMMDQCCAKIRGGLLGAAAMLAVACGPSFKASTPPGFVEIENESDDYDYRATTADGLVIAVRQLEHDPKGEISFWLTAIKNRMRERGGYALLGEEQVQSADGVPGTQLRFGHDEASGKPHLYYLTVFVTPDAIFLVEAGGTKDLMTKHETQVQQAVAGFRTR
jgi:hypothetical protein